MSNSQNYLAGQAHTVRMHKVLTPSHCIETAPAKLLDALIKHLGLKNDAALSRALEISAPMISKLRSKALPVSGMVLVRMNEVTGLDIRELRTLMGDYRRKFGISDQ